MKHGIGTGLAILATAGMAWADGDGPGSTGEGGALRSNLLKEGLKITYKPGSGVTFDGGDEYRLTISGGMQVRWAYTATDNDGSYNTLALRRARTRFDGHVFSEDVHYFLETELGEGTSIKDARIGWRFLNNEDYGINLRVGLQKMRSSLQADAFYQFLEFPERALATRTFAEGRSAGALLEGSLMKNDRGSQLHWHAGLFNNDTAASSAFNNDEGANEGNELNYTLGLMFDFDGGGTSEMWKEGDLEHSGDFDGLIGANLAFMNDESRGQFGPGTPLGDNEATAINVYGAIKTGAGLAAQAELFWRTDDFESGGTSTEADSFGWYAQGSYTLPPGEGTQWGLAARLGMVNFDDSNAILMPRPGQPYMGTVFQDGFQGDVLELNIAANAYYHKHKLKTQIAYTLMDVDADDGNATADSTNHGIDVMFTLLF
jgi:hypothetical protein